MIIIAELNDDLCLSGVVPGRAWAEGVGSQVLSRLLELMEGQVVFWNEILSFTWPLPNVIEPHRM